MMSNVVADGRKTVFVVGAFDMGNYGNLLFPHIAAYHLERYQIKVIPVCPTGHRPSFADAMASEDINEMLCGGCAASAILIGGGNTFHDRQMDFLEEYRVGDLHRWASTGLWLGATLAAAIRDIPVVWNAPGIPVPIAHASRRAIVSAALHAADYVSVRDQGSLATLAPPADVSVAVVPDTVAELARMWPRRSLAPSFKGLLERKGGKAGARYVAVHVRARSLGDTPPAEIASKIDEVAQRQALTPILLAVGPSLGDAATARQLSQLLRVQHVLLDDPSSLREIAAAIAYSCLYIGASLHAYITSAAYNVPGVLVAKPARRKFSGFLDHTGRAGDLAREWPDAFQSAAERLSEGLTWRIPPSVFESSLVHWDRIRSAISDPLFKRRERKNFLQSYLRFSIEGGGPSWALRSFLTKAARSTSLMHQGALTGNAAP